MILAIAMTPADAPAVALFAGAVSLGIEFRIDLSRPMVLTMPRKAFLAAEESLQSC